jgi:hypothetical protein
VESCQGTILGDFCHDTVQLTTVCAFHRASSELHREIVRILSACTLADLLRQPRPACSPGVRPACWMDCGSGLKPLANSEPVGRLLGKGGRK